MKKFTISLYLAWMLSSLSVSAQTFIYDFSLGSHLFKGGVADFGLNQSEQHQFIFENELLPPPFPSGVYSSQADPLFRHADPSDPDYLMAPIPAC